MSGLKQGTHARHRNRFSLHVFLPAMAILAATSPAYAFENDGATAPVAEGETDDAIVVTAQRRSESLQSVPVAVSVVTGDTLVRSNITSLENVSVRQPAVVIRSAPGGDQLYIRGAGSGFNPGFEQSVATFVDGVVRPRARSSRLSLFDVERVEVLRGPQTTYFGANAIAGALNIASKRPGQEFGVKGTTVYSPTYDEYGVQLATDLPVNEMLAFRIAGGISGRDAYTRNIRIKDRGEQNTRQFRISTRWNPTSNVEVTGRFDYGRIRNKGDFALEIVGCAPTYHDLPAAGQCLRNLNALGQFDDKLDRRNSTAFLDEFDSDFYEGVVNVEWNVERGAIIATSSYQDQNSRQLIDSINLPYASASGAASYLPSDLREHYRQFTQELRYQSELGGAFEFLVGGYYSRSRTAANGNSGSFIANFPVLLPSLLTPGDLPMSVSSSQEKTGTLSGFASGDLKFNDQFKLTAGLRYSRVEKNAHRQGYIGLARAEQNQGYPSLDVAPAAQLVQETLAPLIGARLTDYPITHRADSKWMPTAKLSYTPDPSTLVYASYSGGFKAGGFANNDIFDPETVDAYEIGLKKTWLNRRVTTNFALFQQDFQGLQEAGNIYAPDGTSISYIGNVASVRSRGVEFSGNVDLGGGFTLRADVAYLDSRYRSYKDAPCSPVQSALAPTSNGAISCPNDLSGMRRSNSPKWSGSVGGGYGTSVGDFKIDANANVYFRSKYYLQSLPEDITSQDGFAKLDLNFGLGPLDERWELGLFVQNVTNKLTSSFAGHLPASVGTAQRIADPGRIVGFRLTLRQGAGR